MKRLMLTLVIAIVLTFTLVSIFALSVIAKEPGEPGYIGENMSGLANGTHPEGPTEPGELGANVSALAKFAPRTWSNFLTSVTPQPNGPPD